MLPTALRTGDLWFYVGGDVDQPARPTVRVRRGSAEATLSIPTGEVTRTEGFCSRDLRRIRSLVRDHRRLLMLAWEDYARRSPVR